VVKRKTPLWFRTVIAVTSFAFVGPVATGVGQGKTAKDGGVYADAQTTRGEGVYAQQCGSCHGADLKGSGAPALVGQDFIGTWHDMSVADLIDKIATSMPSSAPGSLTRGQVADLVAYIFKTNGFPAGAAELDVDDPALKTLKIAQ
jgi:S-disulfanyl-L-cysteine oxidoreductase SoxD